MAGLCESQHPFSCPSSHSQTKSTLCTHSLPLTDRVPQASHTAVKNQEEMAAMNSGVLACNYVLSGASESSRKLVSMPSSASPMAAQPRVPSVRAQQVQSHEPQEKRSEGRRAALLGLAGVLFTTAATASPANAGVIDEYLEKSKANKELNDKKRLATSGANFARAFTVEFGTCRFPYNFTGCQDLAKQKKVPFISDDLEIECEGKEKYKCGSNVFWKW